jgi:nicotinamidase-related amidase
MIEFLTQPLSARTVHLCVDMQRIFSSEGPWATPWMERVLPVVSEIASRIPERTIFTRFVRPTRPEDMPGMWRRYYERWRETTREHIDPRLLELVDPLGAFLPPATTIEKTRYSAFAGSRLLSNLKERETDTLVVTGSETDVCVLATVLDAVDLGYRVVLVRDAVCSSSKEGHDALLKVYHRRYSIQIETADAEQVLRAWR